MKIVALSLVGISKYLKLDKKVIKFIVLIRILLTILLSPNQTIILVKLLPQLLY